MDELLKLLITWMIEYTNTDEMDLEDVEEAYAMFLLNNKKEVEKLKISPEGEAERSRILQLDEVRILKERIELYKECFERFIPLDVRDEATLFLSTSGSELSKDMARKES